MVTGWRRAFCTSIPKDRDPKIATQKEKEKQKQNSSSSSATTTSSAAATTTATTANGGNANRSPRFGHKFSFFSSSSSNSAASNPSTPPKSPSLRCRTTVTTTPRSSTPASPRSPSTFSLLLKNPLRLSKVTRCGICGQNVKTGQGTAIFTAECSHSFHFPCLKNGGALLCCPVCGSQWKEVYDLSVNKSTSSSSDLKVYDDDEPLLSPVSGIRFNPIPESEEEEEADEFPGFFSDPVTPSDDQNGVEARISSEAAVVAVGRSYETYAVVLTVRAPPVPSGTRRPSVDLVAVLDVGGNMTAGKLHALKRAMRAVISSLSSNDRLSIVVFSSGSKRLLPLRRMTPSGRRSARRIIDALNLAQGSRVNDALRKAVKVLQDRKDRNHFASIILLDGQDERNNSNSNPSRRFEFVSSTRFSHLEIPVQTFRVGEDLFEDVVVKSVSGFLSVVVLDVKIHLGLASGSAPAKIAAVYSCTNRPGLINSGLAKLGDLYSEEEREILIELKVPAASIGSHHFLTVRFSHKDPSTKQPIYGRDQSLMVPRPHTIRSSEPSIQRLRSLFVMTRAVAESRRLLAGGNDLAGAERLLASARAVLGQPSLKSPEAEEFRRRVEAELAEVRRRSHSQPEEKRMRVSGGRCCLVDEKGEPLTPTSAWKAAERLAKVAIMRKSLNRVSDLHGFEDARF